MANSREKWLTANVSGKRILNIGYAGKARDGLKLHQSFFKLKRTNLLVGLDIDKQKVLALGEPNTLAADALSLPFKNRSFDAVVLGEVVEHFWEITKFISEVSRVLKPNGKLFLTTPSPYMFFRWLKCWFLVKDREVCTKNNVRSFLGDQDHKILWEPLSLINLLDRFNLRTALVTTKGLAVPYLGFLREKDWPFWPFSRLGEYLCLVAQKK